MLCNSMPHWQDGPCTNLKAAGSNQTRHLNNRLSRVHRSRPLNAELPHRILRLEVIMMSIFMVFVLEQNAVLLIQLL